MKEFIKNFPTLVSADGHNIDAPFISVIHTDGDPILLRCKEANKKIEVSGGTANVVAGNVTIHYTGYEACIERHLADLWDNNPADKSVTPPYQLTNADFPTIYSGGHSNWQGWFVIDGIHDIQGDEIIYEDGDSNIEDLVPASDWRQEHNDMVTSDITLCWCLVQKCLAEGTLIRMADGSTKPIEDITYDDELKVWDFDKGCYGSAKPLWIMQGSVAPYYWLCKFEDGTELKLIGNNGKSHRVFNYDDQIFEYPQDCMGNRVYTLNGVTKLVSCEKVKEPIKYYNVITNYHMNLFANDVLTSCRYSNVYEIEDMKYVHDGRPVLPASTFGLPEEYYYGLRLGVQRMPIEDTIKYVRGLIDSDIKNSKQS